MEGPTKFSAPGKRLRFQTAMKSHRSYYPELLQKLWHQRFQFTHLKTRKLYIYSFSNSDSPFIIIPNSQISPLYFFCHPCPLWNLRHQGKRYLLTSVVQMTKNVPTAKMIMVVTAGLYWQYAKHCSKGFKRIDTFDFHNYPMRQGKTVIFIQTGKLRHTEVSKRAKVWTQAT